MWKRDEAVKPTVPAGSGSAPAPTAAPPPAADAARTHSAPSEPQRGLERSTVNIGKSVVIKGELSGSEDLTIEGQVDGKIELRQNVLTIGPNGKIKAQVFAKSVVILGEVTGNVTASEKVDIRDNGSVDGDIAAPRVAIAEGAHFRGSIDMQRAGASSKADQKAEQKAEQKADQKADAKPAASQSTTASSSSSPSGAAAGASR
jgi:cytoskeletal protein CcmA (bactofilin family)